MTPPIVPNENPKDWLSNPKNDPLEFLMRVAASTHVSDEPVLLSHIVAAHSIGLPEKKQLSIQDVGESGKGKSHSAQTVFDLFPERHALVLNSESEKWLFYENKNDPRPMILFCPEANLDMNDIKRLGMYRNIIDGNGASHKTLERNKQGIFVPVSLPLPKRCSLWLGNVSLLRDEGGQLPNRLLIVNPDESREQDDRVHAHQVETMWNRKSVGNPKLTEYCRAINQMIIDEGSCAVLIPFAKWLTYRDKSNRRDFSKLTSIIWTITRIRCNSRNSLMVFEGDVPVKHLIAEPADVALGVWLFQQLRPTTKNQVPARALEVLELVPIGEATAISKSEVSDLLKLSPDYAYRLLCSLERAGLIEGSTNGRKSVFWRLANSESSRITSEIRIEWEQITSESLIAAFRDLSVDWNETSEKTFTDYCNAYANMPKSLPSWLEALLLANNSGKISLKSDSKQNPSLSEDLSKAGGIHMFNL